MKIKQSGIFSLGIFLILSVFTLSGRASASTIPAQKETSSLQRCRVLDRTIDEYKLLAEKSLERRAKAIETAKRLKGKINKKQPLSGSDLDMLNQDIRFAKKSFRKLQNHIIPSGTENACEMQ